MNEQPDCRKCENYMRVVDRHGKTRGYTCLEWTDGTCDTSWGFSPSNRCFNPRQYKRKTK